VDDRGPAAGVAEASATSRYARAIVRVRVVVVVLWIAGAVVAATLLPSLGEADTGALGQLVPNDAESIATERRAAELFGFPLLSRTVLVETDPEGLDAEEQSAIVERAVDLSQDRRGAIAGALPVIDLLRGGRLAPGRARTALTYLFFGPEVSVGSRTRAARRLASQIARETGHRVRVTGAVPARETQARAVDDGLPLVTLLTLSLVALAVGVHFRAPLAPILTLVSVGLAYLVASHALAGVGRALDISIPREVEPVIVVLLFGIVTDYTVFFLSRLRHRLADGLPGRRAAESAIAEMQGIVLTAGLIVAAASGSLIVAELGFFQAFGPGMALAVLVGLAVSITFVPACLALLGSAVLWPRARVKEAPGRRAGRSRAVGLAAHHPVPVALAVVAVLGLAASGLRHLDVGQTVVRGLPDGAEARAGYHEAAARFASGVLSPTVVLLEQPGLAGRRDALSRLQRLLERRPGVAAVVGPRRRLPPQPLGAFLTTGGDAARLLVVLRQNPLGAPAIATVRRLRRDLPSLLRQAGLPAATVALAGDTALAEETVTDARADLGRVAPAVLGVVFLLLAIFLRALVAPLYLVAASVLGLAAALGLTVYVFQGLAGHEELTYFVPFAVAVLLLPLGSDYNVFLAGRIWGEARHRPLREAITVAGARAATAITLAGIVLALSFAALATVELRAFRELAFAMTVGLLIDAFLVRTLLVPALIALVGRASGWPGRRLADRAPDPAPPVVPERTAA
jgi:RND superfamily putative drug exporter